MVSRKAKTVGKRPLFSNASASNSYPVLVEEGEEDQNEDEGGPDDPGAQGKNPSQ